MYDKDKRDSIITNRYKHDPFRPGDAITLVRHPAEICVSLIAWKHSGTELTKSGIAGGGNRHPEESPVFYRGAGGWRQCEGYTAEMEAELTARLLQKYHKLHVLATDKLSTAAPRLFAELNLPCADTPVKRQHVSTHPSYHEVFFADELAQIEAEHPTTMWAWNTAMANGGVLRDAEARFPALSDVEVVLQP